jgi:hypothetical protein
MTPEEIGRAFVACERWRWMAGMLARDHGGDRYDRIVRVDSGGEIWGYCSVDQVGYPMSPEVPDVTDPSTLGCIMALVRGAWGDLRILLYGAWMDGQWTVYTYPGPAVDPGQTEPAALLAALQAAP